jgi:hypothetical protein
VHAHSKRSVRIQRNTPTNASITKNNMNRANPIQTIIITQSSYENQNSTKAKAPAKQKRHQRIPSQTMQLSKTDASKLKPTKKAPFPVPLL